MTTRAQTDYQISRDEWEGHLCSCSKCAGIDINNTSNLVHLCLSGTQLYKNLVLAKKAKKGVKK